jgi:hypothetical protein
MAIRKFKTNLVNKGRAIQEIFIDKRGKMAHLIKRKGELIPYCFKALILNDPISQFTMCNVYLRRVKNFKQAKIIDEESNYKITPSANGISKDNATFCRATNNALNLLHIFFNQP